MRDRLIELIQKIVHPYFAKEIADAILADGWIRPPCKAGDTVYVIYGKKVYEAVAEQVTIVCSMSRNNLIKIRAEFEVEDWFYDDGRMTKQGVYGVYKDDVFLIKEEAEQALKDKVKTNGCTKHFFDNFY